MIRGWCVSTTDGTVGETTGNDGLYVVCWPTMTEEEWIQFQRCELDAVCRLCPPINILVARIRRHSAKREEGCGLSEPVIV